ncbi:MAG: hypothetical protein IIC67_05410 [Thaumarchaeota archaeon]|nr:hypothetical protein [Nitrososphaerota archaeon]
MVELISIIAIFVASVSVVIAILTFTLSWNKSKIEKLTHESQFISDIQHELTKSDYEYDKIKTKMDCLGYVFNYLNTLDRLSYFDSKGWLSDDMIHFFKNYLELSLKYYDWIVTEKIIPKEKISKQLPYLKPTCVKHNIKEHENDIPAKMLNYSKLP